MEGFPTSSQVPPNSPNHPFNKTGIDDSSYFFILYPFFWGYHLWNPPPVVEPCPGCRADGGALAGLPGLLCAAGARDPRDRAAGVAQEVPCLVHRASRLYTAIYH